MSTPASTRGAREKKRGFTLVEMVVSLAIFSIVAVIAVGALVRILGQNRQAQAIQSSVNNLSFALESVSRELRTGRNYKCIPLASNISNSDLSGAVNGVSLGAATCPASGNGGSAIAFNSSIIAPTGFTAPQPTTCNLVYAYRFLWIAATSLWEIDKAEQRSCATALTTSDFYPIVASSTAVTGYKLYVTKSGSDKYAKVFIRMAGYSGVRAQDQKFFDVETAISERVTDQ